MMRKMLNEIDNYWKTISGDHRVFLKGITKKCLSHNIKFNVFLAIVIVFHK